MEDIIRIIKSLDKEWEFEELQIATDYGRSETIVTFYLHYIEERTKDPFLCEVFPKVKRLSFSGTTDDTGRVYVKLVFDGAISGVIV